MNPRLSIHGRMSIDGWSGAAGTPIGSTMPTPWNPGHGGGHGRRSSLYRHQTQTLFQAFEEEDGVTVDELDGLTVDLPDGSWFNLRASNTEPLLRLNVEAPDEARMASLRDRVLEMVRA